MLTKDIYGKTLSNDFNNAIESYSQEVKPRIYINLLDSRHLSNVAITNSDDHTSNSSGSVGYYFNSKQLVNGVERQSFTWAVTDTKEKDGTLIKADGRWHAMPATKDEHYEFGYESQVKSTANTHATFNGYELASPVILTYQFTERKVNLIKIITSEYNGQICAYNIKAYHNTNTLVYNEDGEIPENSYYFNHYLENISNDNINKILLTVYTTKNPQDYVRVNEVAPIYRVDITNFVINFNVSKVRDVHETSLPIAGGGSNTAS